MEVILSMKKILIPVLMLTISLSLIACNSKNTNTVTKNTTKTKTEEVKKTTFGDLSVMPNFKVKNTSGNEITQEILKSKKITMINIWGTFCPPCVEEMPTLQQLYSEYESKGFNLIGVISDGEINEQEALKILKESNISFINLIPDEKFENDFVSKTDVVPASIFVNSKGEILETIVGSQSKEDYKKIIEKYIQ